MTSTNIHVIWLVLSCITVTVGLYFVSDYYMDDGWPSAFGRVCGNTVEDDCSYINSHLNTFGYIDYDDNIQCQMQLDAGKHHGALYNLKFKRFELESSTNCTSDYLEMYDGLCDNMTSHNLIGRFCGTTSPNLTGFPTQRFVTLKFNTDSRNTDNGFRILATRTLPPPCSSDYFHCKAENRCIDERLHCDGIPQCDDGIDEHDCSFWDKLIGGFLALGMAGIVGIVGMCICVCTSVGVTICVCTCCKSCCKSCCGDVKQKLAVKERLEKFRNRKVSAVNDDCGKKEKDTVKDTPREKEQDTTLDTPRAPGHVTVAVQGEPETTQTNLPSSVPEDHPTPKTPSPVQTSGPEHSKNERGVTHDITEGDCVTKVHTN